MKGAIEIIRAGPLTTVQDAGRPGNLGFGVCASGPMDVSAWQFAQSLVSPAGLAGIEFTAAGLELSFDGDAPLAIAWAGGHFRITIGGKPLQWPGAALLEPGARLAITPGGRGNYGYLRLSANIELDPVLESLATNTIVGLGGLEGRALRAQDRLALSLFSAPTLRQAEPAPIETSDEEAAPVRIVWGLHADLFSQQLRDAFCRGHFTVSRRLDRMGIRLEDAGKVFAEADLLSLTSDSVVPGDIQILGDGTPIILMRDHQPTGGYPRIATVVSADLDRLAQSRPGTTLRFSPVTVAHAQTLLKG